MNCSNIREHLDEYLDGMLSHDKKAEFDAHLADCSECNNYIHDMKNMLHMMASMEDEELPEGFHSRLHDRLKEEFEKSPQESKSSPSQKWYRWGAGAAAAIVLLLSIKLVDTLNSQRKDSSEGPTPYMNSMENNGAESDNLPEAAKGPDLEQRSMLAAPSENDDMNTPFTITGDTNIKYSMDGLAIQTNEVNLHVYDGAGLEETLEKIYLFTEPDSIPVVEETDDGVIIQITSDEQRTVLYNELSILGEIEETGIQDGDRVTIHIITE